MSNGMMDPELIRIAQEQMNRMSPAELARIQQQMMSNPDLMRMASESMKNMRPEDLKVAAEQLKHTRPEEMTEIGEKMAHATPEEIAAMRARVDVQVTYELNAAEMLKKQGNGFHSQGRFNDASEKYLLAKKNLKGIPSSKARTLLSACSLNLMSCYLKTKQYGECIKEGSEVLAHDAKNLKALYRRGQAYKELGQLEDAETDLSMAHKVSPDDEIIAELLRETKEKLREEGSQHAPRRLVIEEITEEVENVTSRNHKRSSMEPTVAQPEETGDSSKSCNTINNGNLTTNSEILQALKNDPESIRSFQNFIANSDPATLASLNPGKSGEVPPDMIRTASNIIGKMSHEELQKMLEMASSCQGENPFSPGASPDTNSNGFRPGLIPPNMSPDMLKTATDMMGKMSPEDMQKMFEMASSLKGKESFPMPAALNEDGINSDTGSKFSGRLGNPVVDEANVGESSFGAFSNLRNASQSSYPSSTADLQGQMRDQMKDPAMHQMFSSMMKNMSPDMMANMGEQFGLKMSREDAVKAQQAMSSFSPEDLDKMMKWADRLQRGVEGVKKTKSWLLGKPGMILAICMFILAVILHRLGFIGG
ncbi:outer envelope protein 61 [Quillaja saponaria]|uniref:Outer envelope protein 61 n=1 Tax=Quillaja saponaria TaxID=32244 RepID=A0AAD7VMR0_QUISA|nr:outer envelope protein 61 [Quillaja saponaria]